MASKVELLSRKLDLMGVGKVGLDNDDTLVGTKGVYKKVMTECGCMLLAGEGWRMMMGQMGEDKVIKAKIEVVVAQMGQIITELRPTFQVRPQVMDEAIKVLSNLMGIEGSDSRVIMAIDRVRSIYYDGSGGPNYDDLPEVHEGALEMVNMLKMAGRKVSVISHAKESWIRWRLKACGFPVDEIDVWGMDTGRPKAEQWHECFESLGIRKPENFMMVGDNIAADLKVPVSKGAWGVYVANEMDGVHGKQDVATLPKQRVLALRTTAEVVDGLIGWQIIR